MKLGIPDNLDEIDDVERLRAIENRERIRRLYLRGVCDLCGFRTCHCEELTSPERGEQ